MSHTPRRPVLSTKLPVVATAVVAALAVVTSACGGADPEPVALAEPAASVETAGGLVSPEQAAELAARDDVTVIDVRTAEEFAEGHLAGATLIDFYADTFADELAQLDPDETYLIYCRSGNRSGQTVPILAELGIDRVYDLDGGVVAWDGAGLPLTP